MRQSNFGYILRKKHRYYPNRTALVDQETREEISYEALEERSNRVANALADRGVGPGDRVCGLFRNTTEFFDVFFATTKLGAVFAPLNFRLAATELDFLLDDADPEVLIYESVFDEKVVEIDHEEWDIIRLDAEGTGENDNAQTEAEEFATLREAPNNPPEIRGEFEDPAVILYTSGSTGRPKGVPLSRKNLFFSSVCYIVDAGLTKDDVTVTSSPLFHVGGLNILTLPLLHVGGTVILQREFVPDETWALMDTYDVTKMFVTPTMVNMMISVDGWQDAYELDSLELMIAGGEPVPTELKEAFQKIDVPLVPAYGLTETTDGSLLLRPEDGMTKGPKCNGMTFTHVDAKIVDEELNEVPTGEKGELLHRGPTVADGYFELPEKTEEEWVDGWVKTGDIAMEDEDGYIHIFGRKDDMIITGGENVFPSEVEEVLHSNSHVVEVLVFGVPSDKWGEKVKAVISPTEETTPTNEDLRDFLEGRLADYKHPKEVEFVDKLPKSGTGKLERQAIIEKHGGE